VRVIFGILIIRVVISKIHKTKSNGGDDGIGLFSDLFICPMAKQEYIYFYSLLGGFDDYSEAGDCFADQAECGWWF
jgi:hypothetical protein